MDSPQSDDERLQQADAGRDLLSKKMKLLIIMLSLVIIILLLPLASDHGLPLLKPMGISMLQRLWDAMRFIAMTAAISVGIISTSSQRNEGGSNRSAHLRSQRSSTPIASSSRGPINPNMINNFDMNRSGSPSLSVDTGVNDSLHKTSRGTEMGSLRKWKGKELVDDFSTAPSSSADVSTAPGSSDAYPYAIKEEDSNDLGQRTPADHVHSRRAHAQEENYGNLKPRPTNSRRRLSASDAWFLSLRIDEEMEEEGYKSARAMPVQSLEGSPKKFTSRDDKGPRTIKSADRSSTNAYAGILTDDNFAELRMRKATLSRLANETQDANGKGHRPRSSSVDRRRPIHYDDQGPDRPGLKQILMDVSKERASKGKLPNSSLNIKEQSDRPHSAHASVSSNPNAVSTPSSQQPSTGTWPTDSGRITMGNNQILQKKSDSEQPHIIKMEDYQTANQIRQNQDHAIKDHDQRMQENTRPHQLAQRHDGLYQAMVDSAQIKQKQDDLQARVGLNQNLHKQADTKTAIAQTLEKADARMGSHQDSFQSTLHKPNMSSRSKLLLQSSKHSRSELNLEQLEQKVDTVRITQPGTKLYERRKSFSYDFGDGFNPDLLWELEPPPPPGFMDEQIVRTRPNREADGSSFLSATPKPNEASSTLVEDLVPWRTSAPINIPAYPPRTPSPLDPLSQGTGPSSSEVNRRAEEFISKFTTKLLKQRQESMERRRRYG